MSSTQTSWWSVPYQDGLGSILGARVLAEFCDEPNRYASAKSRKNYAGTSPITRAPGTKRVVPARYARYMRLADAIDHWAYTSLKTSPGARAFYDHPAAPGTWTPQVLAEYVERYNAHAPPVPQPTTTR